MTKPATRVDIAFNATYATAAADRQWTDVTQYVKTSEGIRIGHGRQDEFSQPGPNTCSLTLNNSDGRFTPGLASSPYYPNVKIGRPLRVCANLCSFGDWGTFETDATNWSGNNANVARTTAQANSGSASLEVTAIASASMSANTPASTSGIPILPSTTYRASAWYRRGTTSRTCDLRVQWYDAAGASITTETSPITVSDTLTWQQIVFEVTSPSNAAYARVRPFVLVPVAGEVHYIDDVRLDADRFVGYVDEWPLEWPGVVEEFATSAIAASSRMARMGLSDKMRSVPEEEIPLDFPVAHYALSEAEGAIRASDSTGTADPLFIKGSGAALAFGASGPGPDSLTALDLAGGQYLLSSTAETITGVSFFFKTTVTNATIVQIGSTGFVSIDAGGQIAGFGPVVNDGDWHHVFISGDAAAPWYIDGAHVSDASGFVPSMGTIRVGFPPDVPHGIGFIGSLAHLAFWATLPSADRIADHAASVLSGGFLGEVAADRLVRYASYAGIPAAERSFDTDAATPMAHIDTTDQAPVELMQKVAETDGGVLLDGRDGVLTYAGREARYNATAALTLNASASQVEIGYSPKLDRSALVNKVTATTTDGTYSATATNDTSVDEYGVHSIADLELATTDADEAHAAAWWRVNTYGEPSARSPRLGVELAKRGASPQVEILAVKVGDKITVNNLPAQSDENDKSFFVEGWTETITDSQHFIEFNVSPTDGFDVWTVGDATYGQYDAYPLAY